MSITAVGPASAAFQGLMGRLAVGMRVGGAIAGGVGAFLGLARPASPLAVGVAVGVLAGWAGCFAVRLLRGGWSRRLVAVDAALCAVLCLCYGWLVPAESANQGTWVALVASSAVIVGQVSPWRVLGAVGTVALSCAYAVGSVLATGQISPLAPLLAAQGTGAGAVLWLLYRQARAADEAIAAQEAVQREAAVRAARRREEREHCRLLHDSVAATLTVVAAGGVRDSPTLRAQAGQDLTVLERIRAPSSGPVAVGRGQGGVAGAGPGQVDLRGRLELVGSVQPGLAVDVAVADVAVPAEVASALTAAAAEALRNAARHAGADRASLRGWSDRGTVRVEVADAGGGFEPARVPAQRRGLRDSVVGRMADVGGVAAVTSAPGAGTRVLLRWPAGPADAAVPVSGGPHVTDSGLADLVATRYRRGAELALVLVIAIRHVADGLLPLADHRWAYRSFGLEMAAWALMAAAGVVGSVRLLRRQTGAAVSWLLAAVVLVASAAATLSVASGQVLTPAHWALGGAGWFGVLVLLRRPIAELAALIAVNAGLTVAVLVRDGSVDRAGLARFLLALYAIAALQLGLTLVIHALDRTARSAAETAEGQASVRHRVQLAEALHRSRLDRYETVCRSLVPLLVGLENGQLDPVDRGTQHRCAVEGSRLRRLFAETDDVPDPLLHELRACADIAHSRGVSVELQVIGRLPELSRPVRRALTEAPLHVLAAARSQARVTVFGRPDDVAVSVVADAQPGDPEQLPTPPRQPVLVTVQESVVGPEGDSRRWVEARWRGGTDLGLA